MSASPDTVTPQGAARRPFEIRVVSGLVLGFGGLVAVAVLAVLALGIWSASNNTLDLLRDKSQSVLAQLSARVEMLELPAESQLRHIGRQIELGRIDVESPEFGQVLGGALSATPEVRSLVFIHADGRMLRALPYVIPVSLGPRILRAETAVIAALSVIQSICGDWRGA